MDSAYSRVRMEGNPSRFIPETEVTWFFNTWRVECSNVDSNTVFVASRDGLLRSTNGGTDWTFLFNSECTDIEIDQNGHIWAAIFGDGIYKSTDPYGTVFEKMDDINLPTASEIARVEIALSVNNPGVIYAAFERE